MIHAIVLIPVTILFALCTTNAFALDPHVEAVIRTVEGAQGKVEKTEDGQSLKLVDLNMPNTVAHAKRTVDPYDAAFFEHLGHITTLETLKVIATELNDERLAHVGKLTNLKTLSLVNNGKFGDSGLARLVGLTQLESFACMGTGIQGHVYAKFEGWTKLTRLNHRGSSLDDEGLRQICERFSNLESLGLAHAHFTDAGAVHLAKLTKLKNLEIGTHDATPAALASLIKLPLESIQLGEGFHTVDAFTTVKAIPTLRTLSITSGKDLTDADLSFIASINQLEALIMDKLPLPDERLPQLSGFAHLKSISLALRPKGYPPETQAKVKALLPKVDVKFVQ